jgi:hypothetical protein
LAALVFAAFPQVVLGLQTFVVRDFGFFVFPLAHYQRECFWHGQLPLWNPYNNCGVPFLAQWNTMPLYPPALIYLLFPLDWSLSFFSLLHLWWAGLGMYCLAHRWTGNRLAAAAAGLIFAFNGLSLNLLMWPSHMATLSWMPWVVLTVEDAWEEGRHKLVLAALVGALQMLAGGPETILFTWLILLALWVSRMWRVFWPASGLRGESSAPARPDPSLAILWRLPLVVLLVAALAAVQLLPFLDLAAHSQRNPGFADARWSMPAWGWMNFLVPMVYGSVWNKGVFFQYNQAWTSSYYLGVGGLLLALLGVWIAPQRRLAWLLAATGALGLALALGDQVGPVRWLRHLLPPLRSMTYPVKFVTLAVFAAPLLAAFGLARLLTPDAGQRRESQKRVAFLAGLLLALIAGILLWAWRFPLQGDDVSATLRNGAGRAAFLAVVALLLFALPAVVHTGAALAGALAGCVDSRAAPEPDGAALDLCAGTGQNQAGDETTAGTGRLARNGVARSRGEVQRVRLERLEGQLPGEAAGLLRRLQPAGWGAEGQWLLLALPRAGRRTEFRALRLYQRQLSPPGRFHGRLADHLPTRDNGMAAARLLPAARHRRATARLSR